LSFKGHTFEIQFELLTKNSLKVTRKVTPLGKPLPPKNYPEYKKYVEQVNKKNKLLGFK
jgi:hypothetical protein